MSTDDQTDTDRRQHLMAVLQDTSPPPDGHYDVYAALYPLVMVDHVCGESRRTVAFLNPSTGRAEVFDHSTYDPLADRLETAGVEVKRIDRGGGESC